MIIFSGPPVPIEKIAEEYGRNMEANDDPRPDKYKNMHGYQDHVRREVLGYCTSKGAAITLRYLFEGADLFAAQKDHDYLALPFVEYWIDKMLKVSWIKNSS